VRDLWRRLLCRLFGHVWTPWKKRLAGGLYPGEIRWRRCTRCPAREREFFPGPRGVDA
jgi:hypothetical protein